MYTKLEVFLPLLFSVCENVVEFSLITILGLFPSYSSLEELGMIKDAWSVLCFSLLELRRSLAQLRARKEMLHTKLLPCWLVVFQNFPYWLLVLQFYRRGFLFWLVKWELGGTCHSLFPAYKESRGHFLSGDKLKLGHPWVRDSCVLYQLQKSSSCPSST